MSAPAPTKNVVVLGGGGAGVTVAQTISKKLNHAQYNLVLVDQRPHMIWLPASARMVVTHDEEFKDTVRLPATSTRSAIWNFPCHRPCFRMTRSSRKERELSSWYITSRSLVIVVTGKQGKVVAINEAKDQHGGELAFDSGETLNYEGQSPVPPPIRLFQFT